MTAIIIIPARYASTRYPGKPLARINLKDGTSKPLIQLSWEAASKSKGVDKVYIATDHQEIKKVAEQFGASVIMTPVECENGTSRCAEAIRIANIHAELIINFQGDAPLTPHHFITKLIGEMKDDSSIKVATPVVQCNYQHYKKLMNERKNSRVGATTAVFNKNFDALYFSKEVLPFIGKRSLTKKKQVPVYHHVGVYAYKNDVLSQYKNLKEGALEKLEGLEQLRFLENNIQIRCVLMKNTRLNFWELNNPTDKIIIEELLESCNVK